MTKPQLREQYKKQRAALSEQQRLRMDDLLLIRFQQLPLPANANVLLSYWPLDLHAEVNTFLMSDFLQFRLPGLQIAYPVSNFDNHTLQAVLTDDDTAFTKNKYGIGEPADGPIVPAREIDIIFVPLLAFDKNGHRLGYGKGFYDRFLPQCRKDCMKIGFSYFEPLDAIPGIHQFDVPLHAGITPDAIYEF